ncbi:hypothetical protein C8R46DRAFT_1206919 [Mycena filopes]|nr:hypothetical protein C8R46DRAFT_1206919 [Mycena filopes]
MFCPKHCSRYEDAERVYRSWFFYTQRLDFDLRVHDETLVCPPISRDEALAGIRLCSQNSVHGNTIHTPTPATAEIICAAHLVDAGARLFAIDYILPIYSECVIYIGTRIIGPAAWKGVLTVTHIERDRRSNGYLLTSVNGTGVVKLQLDTGGEELESTVGIGNGDQTVHSPKGDAVKETENEGGNCTSATRTKKMMTSAGCTTGEPTPTSNELKSTDGSAQERQNRKKTWAMMIAEVIQDSGDGMLRREDIYEGIVKQYPSLYDPRRCSAVFLVDALLYSSSMLCCIPRLGGPLGLWMSFFLDASRYIPFHHGRYHGHTWPELDYKTGALALIGVPAAISCVFLVDSEYYGCTVIRLIRPANRKVTQAIIPYLGIPKYSGYDIECVLVIQGHGHAKRGIYSTSYMNTIDQQKHSIA